MTSRRSTFNENQAVSYAAVGVSQNADVLIFPPVGFTSSQHEFKLGSGQERFETASIALMTWGVIRGSHLNIISIDRDESDGYNGVMFNEFGAPVAPSSTTEHLFAPDGTAYLSAGTTIAVKGLWSPVSLSSVFRVIYTIKEERRMGYAWGTMDSQPVVGEQLFVVEWRDNDEVYCVVRTVTGIVVEKKLSFLKPLIRLRQYLQIRRYIKSLTPARMS